MTKQTEDALKLAIEQLEKNKWHFEQDGFYSRIIYIDKAIEACKEALEQPAQKPLSSLTILSAELAGVIVDVEIDDGFDDVCLNTVKRVCDALYSMGKSQAQEPVIDVIVDKYGDALITNPYELDVGCHSLYTHPAHPCQECENLKHDLEGYMEANKALINKASSQQEPDIKKMVDRFLSWKLPNRFCSDLCVTEPDYPHDRLGTHLMHAEHAKNMFEYCLEWSNKQTKINNKPVAWMIDVTIQGDDFHDTEIVRDWITSDYDEVTSSVHRCHNIRKLYTHPTEFKTLTELEIWEVIDVKFETLGDFRLFARAIEQLIAKKNGFEVNDATN